MSVLTQKPLSLVLSRLALEGQQSSVKADVALAEFTAEERALRMCSPFNYLDYYRHLKDVSLPVTRETGVLLYMLARSCGARTIVEFGTSFGFSTLHLAAALRDNGGGHLITCESEPSKVVRARANLVAAGLVDLVEFREGDARLTLGFDLPGCIDLLFLDGAKALYAEVLNMVERRLRPGAFIVADNASLSPRLLAQVRSPDGGYLSTSLTGDVEVSMRGE